MEFLRRQDKSKVIAFRIVVPPAGGERAGKGLGRGEEGIGGKISGQNVLCLDLFHI